jgi:hypothetical protein
MENDFGAISVSPLLTLAANQCCQMANFLTKNPSLSIFGMDWVGIFYGHTEYLTEIWYIY